MMLTQMLNAIIQVAAFWQGNNPFANEKAILKGWLLIILIIYADLFASAVFSFETNLTIDLSKKSIILTDAYIIARMKFAAALTNQNAAGSYGLTITAFEAQALCR